MGVPRRFKLPLCTYIARDRCGFSVLERAPILLKVITVLGYLLFRDGNRKAGVF